MAVGVEDDASVGVLTYGYGYVAIGAFFLTPLGEVDIEVGFGGIFEEVAEAVDARAAACRRSVVVVGGGAAV